MWGMAAVNFEPIFGGQGVPINLIQIQISRLESCPQDWLEHAQYFQGDTGCFETLD